MASYSSWQSSTSLPRPERKYHSILFIFLKEKEKKKKRKWEKGEGMEECRRQGIISKLSYTQAQMCLNEGSIN